jgi:hypothetical protein
VIAGANISRKIRNQKTGNQKEWPRKKCEAIFIRATLGVSVRRRYPLCEASLTAVAFPVVMHAHLLANFVMVPSGLCGSDCAESSSGCGKSQDDLLHYKTLNQCCGVGGAAGRMPHGTQACHIDGCCGGTPPLRQCQSSRRMAQKAVRVDVEQGEPVSAQSSRDVRRAACKRGRATATLSE